MSLGSGGVPCWLNLPLTCFPSRQTAGGPARELWCPSTPVSRRISSVLWQRVSDLDLIDLTQNEWKRKCIYLAQGRMIFQVNKTLIKKCTLFFNLHLLNGLHKKAAGFKILGTHPWMQIFQAVSKRILFPNSLQNDPAYKEHSGKSPLSGGGEGGGGFPSQNSAGRHRFTTQWNALQRRRFNKEADFKRTKSSFLYGNLKTKVFIKMRFTVLKSSKCYSDWNTIYLWSI